jgi:hypothetical protein
MVEKKAKTTTSGTKRGKDKSPRPNCIVENCGFEDEICERYYNFESVADITRDMNTRDYFKNGVDMSKMAIDRWAIRSGHRDKRMADRDRILDMVIARGLCASIPIDSRTGLKAVELKMKKHKELDGDTTINVQVITPEQISERINKANRLLPKRAVD